MASSGNFCTLNPLAQLGTSTDASTRSGSMSNGNLKYVNLSGNTAVGNFGVTSGKWYYEVYISSFNADNGMAIGWANDLFNLDAELGYNSPSSPSGGQAFGLYSQDQKIIYGPGSGSSTYNKSYGSGTPTDGDIIRIWLDADNGKFWAGLNGTIWGSGDPSAGTNWGFGTGGSPHNVAISSRTLYPAIGNWSSADATVIFNFGQDSTFQGNVSAGGNTDGNGFGDFKYDTDGFLALCSANVPTSDDIDPAQTEDDISSKQFGAVLYTGNGSSNAVTGLGFQPDLVWGKCRSHSQAGILIDSSRGQGLLFSSLDNTEQTSNGPFMTSYDSDGFTLASSGSNPNDSGRTYVAWCWRANGGTTASNSSGSITSTVQANTKAGFSIMTYTGNGSSGATIGHGLSAKPDLIFTKRRSSSQTWGVYHSALGATKYLALNSNAAAGTDSAFWNNTEPTDSLITFGTEGRVNGSSQTYVAYAWHNVDGYSKFGSYVGNGNADGAFIYTGFRPKMIFLRRTGGTDDFFVMDTARDTLNVAGDYLRWNVADAESDSSLVDFLSNGFKLRSSSASLNPSGSTIVYGAWSDVPFKYNNTF
jgi:hypothetical protein